MSSVPAESDSWPSGTGPQLEPRLRALFWALAIVLGFLQAWANRHSVGGDGVNYLDMASAYFRGNWKAAINGLWSPGYSWLLGGMIALLRPSRYWVFSVVHLANLLLFLVSLRCFEFFLVGLMKLSSGRSSGSAQTAVRPLPVETWMIFGYSLFLWSGLDLIGLVWVNPDMGVAALVYLLAGVLIRIRLDGPRPRVFLILGLLLGFGFLWKAVMFPLALVFIFASFLAAGRPLEAWRPAAFALLAFLGVAGPFVAALSHAKGRLTIGDAGRLNYAWDVLEVRRRHWQGRPGGTGVPIHPTRQIYERPAVFEFGSPVSGTYPLWYDPSYWYEGLQLHFDWKKQLTSAAQQLSTFADILLGLNGAVLIGIVVLLSVSQGGAVEVARRLRDIWWLLFPVAAAVGIYWTTHVESRYIAAFAVVSVMGVLSTVRLEPTPANRRVAVSVALLALVMLLNPLGGMAKRRYYSSLAELVGRGQPLQYLAYDVAVQIRSCGVQRGDSVAVTSGMGRFSGHSEWAYLAGVRIVGEVYFVPGRAETLVNDYWAAKPVMRDRIDWALSRVGARFLVTDSSVARDKREWCPAGQTGYYVRDLQRLSREGSTD